jgi:hypothetical protein
MYINIALLGVWFQYIFVLLYDSISYGQTTINTRITFVVHIYYYSPGVSHLLDYALRNSLLRYRQRLPHSCLRVNVDVAVFPTIDSDVS